MAISGTCGARLTQPKYGINKQNKDREIQVLVSEDVNYLKEISTNERTKQVIKGTEMFSMKQLFLKIELTAVLIDVT